MISDQLAKIIKTEALENPGYTARFRLSEDDLIFFRTCIENQWIEVIGHKFPELVDEYKKRGIGRYHELSHLIDHEGLWGKYSRCLPQEVVDELKDRPFFQDLRAIFGAFELSGVAYDKEQVAEREEIYWRLVRPGVESDVGGLHADSWFHEILNLNDRAIRSDALTIKIWIPIVCEPGRNGLMVVPHSHLKTWKYSVKTIRGLPKPVFEDVAQGELVPTEPGNALIFHENTLHGGAVNRGQTTRVSAEITMVMAR